VQSVPPDYLDRYFERTNNHYVFERDLRKCVIFGRHNVVTDAPISRIDLLVCRNLLIYLESETQDLVLPRLHYALNARWLSVPGQGGNPAGPFGPVQPSRDEASYLHQGPAGVAAADGRTFRTEHGPRRGTVADPRAPASRRCSTRPPRRCWWSTRPAWSRWPTPPPAACSGSA
jgi:hypothetical protein